MASLTSSETQKKTTERVGVRFAAPSDLFADSFDAWIEPAPESASESVANLSWKAWTTPLTETDIWSETDKNKAPNKASVETRKTTSLSGITWQKWIFAALGMGALVVAIILSASSFVSQRRAFAPPILQTISAQKRAAWHKVMEKNAFTIARGQAREAGRNLSANETQGAAQKAALQTVNTNGPDYFNFAAAKQEGAVDGKLWKLAMEGATSGGKLPVIMRQAPLRSAPRHNSIMRRSRPKMARRSTNTSRRAPQKSAVILGRGPVREDNSSIIYIRD